jgi:hypothetical protein
MQEDTQQKATKPMTEGQYRVGVFFNPSGDDQVAFIKSTVAYLIDLIQEVGRDGRCTAIACTELESAAMWAVKSVTKPERDTVTAEVDTAVGEVTVVTGNES